MARPNDADPHAPVPAGQFATWSELMDAALASGRTDMDVP
jgi:hypothetical protein